MLLPKIEYSGAGYNLYGANPQQSAEDGGYVGTSLFIEEFKDCNVEGQFLLPDHTSMLPSQACSYDCSAVTFSNDLQFQAALNASINVDLEASLYGLLGGAFTANPGFQAMYASNYQQNTAAVMCVASCSAYAATLDDPAMGCPALTEEAADMLGNATAFVPKLFLDTQGMFVVTSFTCGAVSIMLLRFSSFQFNLLQQAGINISGGAQVFLLALQGGGDLSVNAFYSDYLALNASYLDVSLFGQPYPAPMCSDAGCANIGPWATSVQLPQGNCVARNPTVRLITDFMTPECMPTINQTTLAAVRAATLEYLPFYCADSPPCGDFSVPPQAGTYHMSPQRDGVSNTGGPTAGQTVAIRWMYQMQAPEMPVVDGFGTVLVNGGAFSLKYGPSQPLFSYNATAGSFIELSTKSLAFTVQDGTGVQAISTLDGVSAWTTVGVDMGNAALSLTPDNTQLIVTGYRGITSLSASNGAVGWYTPFPSACSQAMWQRLPPAFASTGVTLFAACGGPLVAVQQQILGVQTLWTAPVQGCAESSCRFGLPTVLSAGVVAWASNNVLVSFDPDTGDMQWNVTNPHRPLQGDSSSQTVAVGATALFSATSQGIIAVSPITGQVIITWVAPSLISTNVVIASSMLYLIADQQGLVALTPALKVVGTWAMTPEPMPAAFEPVPTADGSVLASFMSCGGSGCTYTLSCVRALA